MDEGLLQVPALEEQGDGPQQVELGCIRNRNDVELAGMTEKVGVNRTQVGGGWFLTPNVLLKGEWVNQKYNDFPTTDIRNGGKFKGFIMEGVVAF